MSVPKTIEIARKYVGICQYSPQHRQLIEQYNAVEPRPRGYAVNVDDDWCDIFVTVVADQAGISPSVGRECGVDHHVAQMRQLGIWQGRVFPQVGDIVVFDYNGGMADHIGYVESVDATGHIQTIEGNVNAKVARQYYHYLDAVIVGYARPLRETRIMEEGCRYSDEHVTQMAQRVLRGEFGNGDERKWRLHLAGESYERIQARVNVLVQEQQRLP